MNFNEKLISLRKSKGLSQEELGAELNVSRQTVSKWESCQSYPDFQRLVLLSDFFGLTLDELVKDIDVQEVREKNLNSERLNSIYSDVENAKKIIKRGIIILPPTAATKHTTEPTERSMLPPVRIQNSIPVARINTYAF